MLHNSDKKKNNKPIAFLLVLALLVSGFAFPGVEVQEAYAAGTGAATLRIEGYNGETLLEETTGTIEPGVTTVGAFVSEICADKDLAFELSSYNFPATIGAINSYWMSYIDNSSDMFSIADFTSVTMANGNSVVLVPDVLNQAYSYFEAGNPGIKQVGDYYQATVPLILCRLVGYSEAQEAVEGATVTAIDATTYPEYPSIVTGTTDENGRVTLNLWSGTYIITAEKLSGSDPVITKPYAKVIVGFDGSTTIQSPKTPDVGLEKLEIELPSGVVDVKSRIEAGNPYVNTTDSGSGITITAIAASLAASISISQGDSPSELESGVARYLDGSLASASNSFAVTVTNGEFSKTYAFYVNKVAPAIEDEALSPAIESMLAAVSGKGMLYYESMYLEYVTALYAGEGSLSDGAKTLFLQKVLDEVRSDNGSTSVGRIGKIAAALTAVGIDPRQVPDISASVAAGTSMNLIDRMAAHTLTGSDAYNVPYMLIGYDSGNYSTAAGTDRTALINYMLSQQAGNGGFAAWPDTDTTALYIMALSPYYNASGAFNGVTANKVTEIKASVERALNYLKSQQVGFGCFSGFGGYANSNSTSLVISALAAIGEDPHGTQFMKDDYSALQGLLSYKTEENLFGITDSLTSNYIANGQGMMALVGYKNYKNTGQGNPYRVAAAPSVYTQWPSEIIKEITFERADVTYKAGDNILADHLTVSAVFTSSGGIRTEIIGQGDGTAGYKISGGTNLKAGGNSITLSYLGKSVTFVITALNSDGTQPAVKTVNLSVKDSGNNIIASQKNIVIQADVTTVLDALKTVLKDKGIPFTISGGMYVSSIDEISEFSEGPYSGWLFSINGVTPPTTGAGEYTLSGNETIVWYFSKDYTKDASSASWSGSLPAAPSGITSIEAKVDAFGNAKAAVSSEELKDAISAGKGLSITSEVASVSFGPAALSAIGDQTSGDLSITMNKADTSKLSDEAKLLIGNRPVYEFAVKSGARSISQFGGKVTVSLAYKPAEGEDPNALVICYINSDGKLELVKNCVYNEKTGTIEFVTDHFSAYGVGYNFIAFDDTKTHWAKGAVSYLASRGMVKGLTAASFAPDKKITRAEFITILANKAGADLTKPQTQAVSFADVKAGDWYANAVAWAAAQGVTAGMTAKDGSLLFQPNVTISRQDMAVMLSRYLANVEKTTLQTPNQAMVFADNGAIADYASQAVKTMQQAGIINGKTATTFAPRDNATRAEACQMISQLMKASIN